MSSGFAGPSSQIAPSTFRSIAPLTQTPLPPPVPPDVVKELLTFSRNYNKPIRPVLEIRDVDFNLLHKFDTWDVLNGATPEILINRIECVDATNQAGNFSLSIIDHERTIDPDSVGNSNWVIIRGGRNSAQLTNFMYGVCRDFQLIRGKMDKQYWIMSGYGSGLLLTETLLNVTKNAAITDLGLGSINKNDEEMFANHLIE